ncbi:hypothetical protein SERLA73DRAFT_191367 [Serpula lacrymans var. lacrymans S7.3]|uniref:N-acetyltransferase domain-containing protein n=2 Tax=Serpula lacrymans var. lacrymans TaxID=341189 RepID=F8QHE2_SERL3|nr:uncharacterized protein SERLADRAFT_472826 [Serpula lacrymans var. lacrymans S7.9]EGN92252.1 hypothetical protein SERLA73DRAFT_191367 [Serpula lacrymans var. lacrymans S7.3]EGO22259.1 hypothetical protein SERLADRAFT_472826 [Serpula lacrymans var. lacrymans S7.9]
MTGCVKELREMTLRAIVSATVIGGHFYVALDQESGKVLGTACWYPPQTDFLLDEKQQKQEDVVNLLRELGTNHAQLFSWWMSTLLPKSTEIYNSALGNNNFILENWNLYSFTVEPAYQGKRIGSKLLKIGEDGAREMKTSVCFGTNSGPQTQLYEHKGYEIKGQGDIPPPPGHEIEGYTMLVYVQSFVHTEA